MKDGRTHLAHKFEQAVDMETGAVVAVTGRRWTAETRPRCRTRWTRRSGAGGGRGGAQGSGGRQGLPEQDDDEPPRSYVSEPNRGRRSWKRKRRATYANRRRIRG